MVKVMCDFAPGVIKDTSKGGFTVLTIAAQHGHLQVHSSLDELSLSQFARPLHIHVSW